jgi:lipopolysaccharide transport system ATP-binding protein
MSDIAIKVENLSKRYRIGLEEELPDTLVGAVAQAIKRPLRNWRRLRRLTQFDDGAKGDDGRQTNDDDTSSIARPERGRRIHRPSSDVRTDVDRDTLWALKDVSFQVERGEVVGIIGRNGAGKSTLLKILSRITVPTEGRAVINGRVGSLLEVGTGFHQELTGRENIYLSGAILGMTKSEIDRKFDEIVDFSGVERFIDTPLKRYSSGMRVRLGFAVAAHLDPEILLIDEVLAVGDAAFQKKCLGKMGEVAGAGRTVLFVSHNMQMIDELCPRTVLLNEGSVVADGPTGQVVGRYYELLRATKIDDQTEIGDQRNRRGTGRVRFTNITVQDVNGSERFRFRSGETVQFRLSYTVMEAVESLYTSIILRSGKTREPLGISVKHCVSPRPLQGGQDGTFVIEIPRAKFRPGTYPLYFWLGGERTNQASRYENRRPYDVVDDLTPPLVIYSEGDERSVGVIDIDSRIAVLEGGDGTT